MGPKSKPDDQKLSEEYSVLFSKTRVTHPMATVHQLVIYNKTLLKPEPDYNEFKFKTALLV